MSTNSLTPLQEVKLNSFLFECGARLSDWFLIECDKSDGARQPQLGHKRHSGCCPAFLSLSNATLRKTSCHLCKYSSMPTETPMC